MFNILDYCKDLPHKYYEPYQVVLEQGGRTNKIFILAEGEIVIEKEGVEVGEVTEPGTIFGEMSILLDKTHTATVKTASPSKFYVAENGLEFIKSDIEIAFHILKLLANRLDGATTYIVEAKDQYREEGSYHLDILDTAIENILYKKE